MSKEFEEQFPSLEPYMFMTNKCSKCGKYDYEFKEDDDCYHIDYNLIEEFTENVDANGIRKHCLDKQIVKDAIDKIAKETVELGYHCPYDVANRLKQELGLDKDE